LIFLIFPAKKKKAKEPWNGNLRIASSSSDPADVSHHPTSISPELHLDRKELNQLTRLLIPVGTLQAPLGGGSGWFTSVPRKGKAGEGWLVNRTI
jgi:hypothetical protein